MVKSLIIVALVLLAIILLNDNRKLQQRVKLLESNLESRHTGFLFGKEFFVTKSGNPYIKRSEAIK